MNDNQNNNLNNEPITITPITPQVAGQTSENNDIANNSTQINTIQVPPINNNSQNNQTMAPQNNIVNNNQNILTPKVIVPEMKNENNNAINENLSNNNPSLEPQLNLESSSPFDIGINTPLNTSEISIQQPLPTNTNENQSIANDNNNNPIQDINIEQNNNSTNITSMGSYLLLLILFSIPLIGFIILIVKVLDKKDKNISNFAKAYLLFGIIILVIGFLAPIVFKIAFPVSMN